MLKVKFMNKIRNILLALFLLPVFSSCAGIFDSIVDFLIEDKDTRETVKVAASIAKEVGEETVNVAKEIGKELISMESDTVSLDPLDGYKVHTIQKSVCNSDNTYKFPRIEYKDKYVERKVNAMLQLLYFGVLLKDDEGNGFDGINHIVRNSYDHNLGRTVFYDNTFSRCISIRIDEQKYGGEARSFFNFNPKTGELYHLEDFFYEAAYYEFQSKILGYKVSDRREFVSISFSPTQTKLFLIIRGEGMRMPAYEWINISDIEHLLNDYGRAALITGEGLENYHTNVTPLLYEGKIGEEPVIFLRTHPFGSTHDALYFLRTGKFGRDNSIELLREPEQPSAHVQVEDRVFIDICNKYWNDCQIIVKHIDKLDPKVEEGKINCNPWYLYNDIGRDLFCFRITSEGLEGYYQIPYPIDHDQIVYDYDKTFYSERELNNRVKNCGMTPKKFQVKLKKM